MAFGGFKANFLGMPENPRSNTSSSNRGPELSSPNSLQNDGGVGLSASSKTQGMYGDDSIICIKEK